MANNLHTQLRVPPGGSSSYCRFPPSLYWFKSSRQRGTSTSSLMKTNRLVRYDIPALAAVITHLVSSSSWIPGSLYSGPIDFGTSRPILSALFLPLKGVVQSEGGIELSCIVSETKKLFPLFSGSTFGRTLRILRPPQQWCNSVCLKSVNCFSLTPTVISFYDLMSVEAGAGFIRVWHARMLRRSAAPISHCKPHSLLT